MNLIYFSQQALCDKAVVDLFSSSTQQILRQKKQVILGISGGRSVQGIFTLLREAPLPWRKIHIFMADERLVSITSPESNFYLARKLFLDRLLRKKELPVRNVHPFYRTPGIMHYAQELQRQGGQFDILLLGVGADGHIASLFPHHLSLHDKVSYFLALNNAPLPPTERMTISPALVQKAGLAILLFYGKAKAGAYRAFRDRTVPINECPAKLALAAKELYVVTDLKPD